MKLPLLGFVTEDDPIFVRTYEWLHSNNYKFPYSDRPCGLPGSYRLPFTTSWSVADHLSLARGREQALKVLRANGWDGGIHHGKRRPDLRPDGACRACFRDRSGLHGARHLPESLRERIVDHCDGDHVPL